MLDFDPFDVRTAQQRDADRRHEAAVDKRVEAEDWAWLLGNKRGRRIVRELLEYCGVDRVSYTGNSETFFREGQRSVGLRLITAMQTHAPEHYLELLKDTHGIR